MPTARMLVAAHKPADVPADDFYLPVHVGHALAKQNIGFQPDSSGNNISTKNASFCELTALFWAWQNLDADVVGLSHYRRYFVGSQRGPNGAGILSAAEAEALLTNHDLVLGKPRNYVVETIDTHYRNGHYGSDLDVLRDVLDEQSPHLIWAYNQVFTGRKLSLYNMFLMRRDEFDAYCAWLFPVLEAVEGRIDNASRSAYQQRTFGYLAERLLNVWAVARRTEISVTTRAIINSEGEPKLRKAFGMLQRKLMRAPAGSR